MRPRLLTAALLLATSTLSFTAGADVPERPPLVRSIGDARASSLAPTGAMGDLTVGASYLGGEVAKGVGIGVFQISVGLRGGYHFTRHLGVFAGLEAGHGFLTTACFDVRTGKESTECKVYSLRVPILVEYAFADRSRGAYVMAGATAFDLEAISAAVGGGVLLGPIAASMGMGVRTPVVLDRTKTDKPNILEFRARLDGGRFVSANGREIAAQERSFYAAIHFSGGWVF